MPAFVWKGKNRLGEVQEGVIVSEGKDQAVATLKRNGIQVLSVQAQRTSGTKSLGKVKAKDHTTGCIGRCVSKHPELAGKVYGFLNGEFTVCDTKEAFFAEIAKIV